MLSRILSVCCLLTVIEVSAAAEPEVADDLLARAVAGRLGSQSNSGGTPGQQTGEVQAAVRAQGEAELELAIGTIRLGLLRARTRLLQDRYDDAIAIAQAALHAVTRLPESVDRGPLAAPLEKVIIAARVERGGGPDAGDIALSSSLEDQLRAAERELAAATAPRKRYYPRGESLTETDIFLQDIERRRWDADLRLGYKIDEADALVELSESRRVPRKLLTYPQDWEATSERRKRVDDGIMYRGPEFRGEDGELRRLVIYDIRDLNTRIPKFGWIPVFTLGFENWYVADGGLLTVGSTWLFPGDPPYYPHQESPPLRYLGLDEWHIFSGTNGHQRGDLMRVIEEVLHAR